MLNPLFAANRWDWQPHYKLGQSTWLCCVQVPHCCWWKATRRQVPGTIVRSVVKLASINLWKFGSFSYRFDKPWFHNWGKLTAVLIITFSWGFPTSFLVSTTHQRNSNQPQTQKNSYIATTRDKWPSLVIGYPMRSTYLENCSGAMLTFMPSSHFTKTHTFCT
jgi:hypothetical protein